MGYNSEGAGNYLVFDIETASVDGAADYIEAVEAPSNYKDPAKIAAYIEEKRAELVNKCALDPDLCRVVCIGMDDGQEARTEYANNADDEPRIIKLFWWWYEKRHPASLVGFNILSYDLPVLMRRSQYLGIDHPNINLDRYRTPHIDLMQRLTFNGAIRAHSLSFYCKRFGIDVADDTSGKDIAAFVADGNWEAVANHCRADVEKTVALARRLNVLPRVGVAA